VTTLPEGKKRERGEPRWATAGATDVFLELKRKEKRGERRGK